MVLPANVAAGHSAAVQPELAAQVNAAVSLYRTRMYGEYHVLSSLLILPLIIHGKAHLTHLW